MMSAQCHLVVSISPQLKLGVIFAYTIGNVRKGAFHFFCNKQEGLEKIVGLCDHPLNEPGDWQEFVDMITDTASLVEFSTSCTCPAEITEEIRIFLSDEVMPQCIQ